MGPRLVIYTCALPPAQNQGCKMRVIVQKKEEEEEEAGNFLAGNDFKCICLQMHRVYDCDDWMGCYYNPPPPGKG